LEVLVKPCNSKGVSIKSTKSGKNLFIAYFNFGQKNKLILLDKLIFYKARDGIRTRDPRLGKPKAFRANPALICFLEATALINKGFGDFVIHP
jgi:hypothetical protein